MTTLATDDCSGTDENPLTGDWTTWTANGLARDANRFRAGTNSANCGSFYNAVAAPDDQWSEIEIPTLGAVAASGPAVRCSAANGGSGYYLRFSNSNTYINFHRRLEGVVIQIDAVPYTPQAGDRVRLEVVGTSLSAYVNDALVATRTDAAIASGQFGLHAINTDTFLDNWEGGDFAAADELQAQAIM